MSLKHNDLSVKHQKKFKLVILGDQNVGKTSLITRFMYDSWYESYEATIGIDFLTKSIRAGDDTSIKLQLWDTAGQERFRCLIPSYIRDSNVAIIVYDVTNPVTFQSIRHWIDEVRAERREDVIVVAVGNKIDMNQKRQVSTSEGRSRAAAMNVLFVETSAKDGHNVKHLFECIANALLSRYGDGTTARTQEIVLGNDKPRTVGSTSDSSPNCYC